MDLISVILIALVLALDAFSIAVSKGLCARKIHYPDGIKIGISFGIFQFAMPIIGWSVGSVVSGFVSSYGKYISFALLAFLGGKMIIESFKKECDLVSQNVTIKELVIFGIATSIDALVVGFTFAMDKIGLIEILIDCTIIGVLTALISFFGYLLGHKLSKLACGKAELFGGLVLLAIGIKTLITG